MWEQQSADGGWHSQTHAVLRDGRVLTPFILFHLIELSEEKFPISQASIDSGVEFIIKEMWSALDEDSTALTDYPNYSAAYSLRVLHKLNRDTSLQRIIASYLIGQQFIGHRGFTPDNLAYGGWGYGEPNLKYGQHGHVDLSHTRRITEALEEAGSLNEDMKHKIRIFLNGVQRREKDYRLYAGCTSRASLPYDGGFVSSLATLATNKSQPVEVAGGGYHYPSYATATCDGLLAMHALKMEKFPQYMDASNWLTKYSRISGIDGLLESDPEQWGDVMHYYHLSVRSESMSIIDPGGAWRDSIETVLIGEQLPGGYYINPIGGVNKEDDPLMATIFAIQAGENVLRARS